MKKIKCNCKHDGKGNEQGAKFQDGIYGEGVRIATTDIKKPATHTCTVCGTKHKD